MRKFSRVSVIGLGYIGLPTAAMLASRGLEVIGVDVSPRVVEAINNGEIHIEEPDLDVLVRGSVNTGKLRATMTPEPAEVFIIAVPTPLGENKSPDLSYVWSATEAIAPVIAKGDLVILESTSPVGTTEGISKKLAELRPDLSFPHLAGELSDVRLAHCPERVLPGYILRELVDNDRVIGGVTPLCAEQACGLYKTFVRGACRLTTCRTAEMCKLTENAFRDVNIAFANELSLVCDAMDMDVWELISLANLHPRVNVLSPGIGVGGHCIPIDPYFIVAGSPENTRLIQTARAVNDAKTAHVTGKILERIKDLDSPTVACMGLAFKPDIDDLRESPALAITQGLAEQVKGTVLAVEPNVDQAPQGLGKAEFATLDQALDKADALVFLVRHTVFTELDKALFEDKTVIDFVNIL